MALKAKLHIETALRGETTFLKSSFHAPPFKIANVSEGKAQLKLMLMNASPGVLDGDEYFLQIHVAAGCSLMLQTQSYQRLFQMQQGAIQSMHVIVSDNASFFYLPHPTVPHQDAIFKACNKIMLTKSSSLIWGEVISCGRKMNGEIFAFSTYHSITEIWVDNKLAIKENVLLQPAKTSLTGIGQLEGYTHQASLICITEKLSVDAAIEKLLPYLEQQKQLAFGITALPVTGMLIRLMGYKAEQLFTLLQWAAQHLEAAISAPQKKEAYVI